MAINWKLCVWGGLKKRLKLSAHNKNISINNNNGLSNIGRYQYFVFMALVFYFTVPHHFFTNTLGISSIKIFDLAVPIALFFYVFYKIKIIHLRAIILLACIYITRSIFEVNDVGFIGITYALKLVEYIIVIFCIFDLRPVFVKKLLSIYLFFIFAYIFLELLGFNTGLVWGDRISGHFGGPYELSAIALLFIFFYHKSYLIILLFIAIIFLTGTKAAYLALAIGMLLRSNIKTAIPLLIVTVSVFFIAALFDERFIEFISNLTFLINSETINTFWADIPKIKTHAEYMDFFFQREGGSSASDIDLSTFSRLNTYLIIIKSFSFHTFVVGHGPGFFGQAVDSSILRIIAETGLIGFILFIYAVKSLIKNFEKSNINLLIILSIVALSDVFFAARFLPTLAILSRVKNLEK